jgi:integrase
VASIRKRKRATRDVWLVDYRDARGMRHRLTAPSKETAEELFAEKVKESRQAAPALRCDPNVTLSQYVETWKGRAESEVASGTFEGYVFNLNRHILHDFGTVRVRDLHRSMIRDHLAKKRNAGLGKNTVRLIRAALSVVLSEAVEDGVIQTNPCFQARQRRGRKRVDKLTRIERRAKVRPFDAEELSRFLIAAEKHEPRYAPVFLLLARTGMRPGEGLALKWEDLDFGKREILVERAIRNGKIGPTKTGEDRRVDMSQQLVARLDRLLNERKAETLSRGWRDLPDWVFCSTTGTALDQHNLSKAFRRCLKAAELPLGHSPYDLRHSVATLLLAKGKPITYVAAQLGHANPATTLTWYARWLPSGDKSHVDALDDVAQPHDQVATATEGARLIGLGIDLAPIEKKVSAPGGIRTPNPQIRSLDRHDFLSLRATTMRRPSPCAARVPSLPCVA